MENSIPQSVDGLYQISLYPTSKKVYYCVPSADNKGLDGIGSNLCHTLEEAIVYAQKNRKEQARNDAQELREKEYSIALAAAIEEKKQANKGKTKLQIMNESNDARIWNNWKAEIELRTSLGYLPVVATVTDTNATTKRLQRYEYLRKVAFGCNENNPLVKERLQLKNEIDSGSIKKEEYHLENSERCYIVIPKIVYTILISK